MSKEIPMPITVIRHRGYFDYDKLFQTWQGWYGEQGFFFPNIGDQILHPHKISDFGWEDRMLFSGDKRVTEFVRFRIELKVVLQNMKDVEVVQEGKKRKLTEGLVLIEVIPYIQFDYRGIFDGKGKAVEWMGKVLQKYILKYKIGDYWEDMLMDMAGNFARTLRHALEQEII